MDLKLIEAAAIGIVAYIALWRILRRGDPKWDAMSDEERAQATYDDAI